MKLEDILMTIIFMQIMKKHFASILDVYKDEFPSWYKLYINESKLEFLKRPLFQSVAVVKKNLQN